MVSLGIAMDDLASLTKSIEYGLECDGLCITGGVSMGAFDFVPDVLAQCGVQVHFHKMSSKPGKPTLFGTTEKGTCVFGLPGNPVSAMVGYWMLVRPAFAAMQGRPDELPKFVEATLVGSQEPAGDRDSFWPARIDPDQSGRLTACALSWHGSGDPFGMGMANGWIVKPAGSPATRWKAGRRGSLLPARTRLRVVPGLSRLRLSCPEVAGARASRAAEPLRAFA